MGFLDHAAFDEHLKAVDVMVKTRKD